MGKLLATRFMGVGESDWSVPDVEPELNVRQQIGVWCAAIGAIGLAAALPFKVTAMHIPAGLAALGIILARLPVLRTPGFWPAILLLVWGVGSMAAVGPEVRRFGILYVPLAASIMLVAVRVRPWVWRWCIWVLLGGAVVQAILGLVQFTVGYETSAGMLQVGSGGRRFDIAPGFREGNVGPSILAGSVLILMLAHSDWKSKPRWVAIGAAGLMVALNQSRAAVVSLASVAGFWRLNSMRSLCVRLLCAALLVIIGGVILYFRHPDKFNAMLRGDDHRLNMWRFAASEIVDRPVLGSGGQKGFSEGLEQRWQQSMGEAYLDPNMKYNLHNTPINYSVFFGLPAGALHVLFLAAWGIVCWRSSRRGGVAFAAWCFVAVGGLFDATWNSQKTAYSFSVLLAMVLYADQRKCAQSLALGAVSDRGDRGVDHQPAPLLGTSRL